MADLPASPVPVLRLITRLNIGGPARQALLLSHRLRPRYATTLAAGRPAEGEGELSDPDVEVVRVPLVRPLRPAEDVRALVDVRRLLRRDPPRILHTHMAKAGTVGRLAAATLGRRRPRTVHTFHGHVLDGYFSPAVTRAFIQAERWLAARTDLLIAVSDEVRDALLELRIGRPSQWRTVPLGLDLDVHLRVSGRSGQLREDLGLIDEPLVAVVGRLVPIKDVATAIRVVAGLDGVHLAVVGDGEERARLESLAEGLAARARIHFTGWRHDMPAVMADADVVLLTSRNEGTPVALIEAQACARPVVATDVGGVRAVVLDGETGLVVPIGDDSALTAALERLLQDPDLRKRFGAAGREHTRKHFSADRLVEDIGALYRQLLDRP